MSKKTLAFWIILLILPFAVFAGGRKANESHEVSNPNGFTESVNIEDKKPGKWNFYMEAKDKGGNTTLAGPYNMYIDPVSDLPIARIINPQPNMHVQGNLNLVGTCIDDDGVDHVELVITRGSDGKGEIMLQTRAEGGEFWSYFLDTSDTSKWRDGMYTVTAWGVDINGLSGISDDFPSKVHKKHQITWNLDRKKPEITLTSHELGALLSGKVTLKGTVWDGNGIDFLSYSLDNGISFQNVSLKYDKKNDIYNYSLNLDTRTVEDGPAVIQFRARDKMKTEGVLSFLIFANNTGPDVKILYPDPEEAVSGVFSVAGYAMHKVGIASLSYKLGKDSGEIPLVIGNPWWVKEFDIRGQNTKSLDLEIRAVDLSGNVSVAKRKIVVDQEAGRPKVTLAEPPVITDFSLKLIGSAEGINGVEAILYSIDGHPAAEVSSSGNFQFFVDDITPGSHTVEVWARSGVGVEGPKLSFKNIIAPGAAPEPRITLVRTGSGKTAALDDFYSGIEVDNTLGASLDLLVSSGSALQSITYQLGGRAPIAVSVKGSKGGEYVQSIPIPKDMESGFTPLNITVSDIYYRETNFTDFLIVSGTGAQAPAAEDFIWVRPNIMGDGRILLSTRDPLIGIYSRGALMPVQVSGSGVSSLDIRVNEKGQLVLLGGVDGSYGPLHFNLTGQDGRVLASKNYSFLVDSAAPQLDLMENPDGKWVQNQVPVKFRASDENDIKALEYSIDLGNSWRPMLQGNELAQANSGSVLDRSIDISSCPDGTVTVSIRAVDTADKETIKSFIVNKDTKVPEARLVVPLSGERVNGKINLGFSVKDAGKLASVFYQRPAGIVDGNEVPAISKQVYPSADGNKSQNFLPVLLDPKEMPLADNMSFVFTDMAGNRTVLSQLPFIIDEEMDLPVVQISLPLENEVITSDFVISGVCYDDDEVKCIYWSMDYGYEQVLNVKNGFAIPISLASLTDNEHSISIYAEDIYGIKGKVVTRNFRVSLEEPKASVTLPTAGEIVGGMVRITGVALDENGIQGVQVSLDNGNTFNDAEGTTRWTYVFNSKIIPDGNHAVFVRVWDKYDVTAIYSFLINIDNTPPELTIDTPSDGAETTGPLYITGQVMDNMKLDSVTIKLSSLEGTTIPPGLAEKTAKLDSLILEEMDLGSLPDGSYNVEIWAVDKAENISRISRNIVLAKDNERNFVDVLYPMNGEYVQGNFNLYGMVGGIDKATQVDLVVNGIDVKSEEVTNTGYFRFDISEGDLSPGSNKIVVRSNFGGQEMVQSTVKVYHYQPTGPWVTVDTLNMGDFAYDRPWLRGRAGYQLTDDDKAILGDKKISKDQRAGVEAKKVDVIELSFNNGRTFFPAGKPSGKAGKGYDWQFRLETQDMTEGLHYLIARVTMVNGEAAVTRLLIQVDKTPPLIRLISPESGGRYNNELKFAALASDDQELKTLSYYLRKGDKSAYEVPGFIKGLYLEATIPPFIKQIWNDAPSIFGGGATYMDFGLGLSFFDDNVKIQVQYGLMTQSLYESLGGSEAVRYGGHVLGLKILANVYTLPFATFGGPDWEWLSASFALGANFSLFDLAKQGYTQSGEATWLSALLFQVEFPKVTIPRRTYLRTFSLFTEGQLWFVPTDVNAAANNMKTVIPHMILGLRMYIF